MDAKLISLPTRYCVICGADIEKREDDDPYKYSRRKCCGKECARTRGSHGQYKKREKQYETGVKTCPICNKNKPLAEFPVKKGKQGLKGVVYYQSYCSLCSNELKTEIRLRKLFNISSEEYNRILQYQKGGCALCGIKPNRSLHVDHNHKTGLIRGLICWFCNQALGYFKDDLDSLAKAVSYLSNPPAVKVLGEERFGCKGRTTSKANRKKKLDFDVLSYVKHKHQERLVKTQ